MGERQGFYHPSNPQMTLLPINYKNNSFFFLILGHTAQHVGSQFPNQGSNPCSLQWKRGVLTTGPPGKSLKATLEHLECADKKATTATHGCGATIRLSPLAYFLHGLSRAPPPPPHPLLPPAPHQLAPWMPPSQLSQPCLSQKLLQCGSSPHPRLCPAPCQAQGTRGWGHVLKSTGAGEAHLGAPARKGLGKG